MCILACSCFARHIFEGSGEAGVNPPKEVLPCTLLQIFAPRVASCLHVLYKRVESCRKFFGDIVEFFGCCDAHKRVYKRCEGGFLEFLRD